MLNKFLSLFVFVLFVQAIHASCDNALLEIQQDFVTMLRSSNPTVNRTFIINGQSYEAEVYLGDSVSRVYLARDIEGKKVVIKDYSETHKLQLREIIITRFLQEEGVDVPQVLDFDLPRGLVVKEYVDGLFRDELSSYFQSVALSTGAVRSLQQQYRETTLHLEEISKKFPAWRKQNALKVLPQLSQTVFLERDLSPHIIDVKPQNFIYSFKKQKWIIFDP